MSSFNILHLTDWHINNPNSLEEKLREGYYRDYIISLYNKVKTSGIDKIDLLLCTGDFIDRGKEANFSHAEEVLNFIISKFSIANNSIFLNIGNHDISVLDHKKGSKESFLQFESKYSSTSKKVSFNDLYDLIEINDKIYLLKLDSIFNEKKEVANDETNNKIIYPSSLEGETIDIIVTEVIKKVPTEALLIVTSHFPMVVNNRMTFILEDETWLKKHLWKSGALIAKRILENRIDNNVLFLCGDGHLDNFWSYSPNHHFFMTGMFGGDYITNHYISKDGGVGSLNKTNDAKVIQYDETNLNLKQIFTFNYEPEGYIFSSQTGKWKLEKGEIRIEANKSINYPNNQKEEETIAPKTARINYIQCISSSIEDKIIEEIRIKGLFTISRTATSEKESSLGWISISNLFQNHELFCSSIEKMKDWIIKNGVTNFENCIICGLGFWGSVFGTQLGAVTGILSFCIASKRIKINDNYFESIEYIKEEVKDKQFNTVIILTDVISTGNSIITLKSELSSKINLSAAKWYSMSVLSDKTQERLQNITEFESIGSLCVSLPIPVINNDQLPDESIFPITFDFR